MNPLTYEDSYVSKWNHYKKLHTYFRFPGLTLLSVLPLTESYIYLFEKKSFSFEKPGEIPLLLSFTIVYLAIAIRYLRLELVLRALKQNEKEKAVRMLDLVYLVSITMMVLATSAAELFLLYYRNFYFGLWLEGVLLFYLLFAVPGPNSLQKLRHLIELYPLIKDQNGGRGGI